MKLNYKVKSEKVINKILKENLNVSTRLLNKLINLNKIYLNGNFCDTRCNAKANDIITIDFNYDEDNSNIVASDISLDIKFEDDWLLVINKPAGIPVHPSCMHYSDSLCNGVKFYFDKIGLKKKLRPVNRLDLNTSRSSNFCKM